MLTNLSGPGRFVFEFPGKIRTTRRNNWPQQNTIGGMKPLHWANRDADQITPEDLWLDRSSENASITPDIEALEALLAESRGGTPPILLAQWGDRSVRCVIENFDTDEEFFMSDGRPLRARVDLVLTRIQEDVHGRDNGWQISDDPQSHFLF